MTDFPTAGRIAGIDYGSVRIGIAISDAEQQLASPLDNYTRRGPAGDEKYFTQLVANYDIAGFVIGLPVHTDGRESQKSIEARRFGTWLAGLVQLPITFYDERFTSVEAEQMLEAAQLTSKRRKKRRDMLAAHLILSGFLESLRHDEPPRALDD